MAKRCKYCGRRKKTDKGDYCASCVTYKKLAKPVVVLGREKGAKMSYGFGRLNELCERAYKTSEEHGFWALYKRTITDAENYRAAIAQNGATEEELKRLDNMRDDVQAAIIAQKMALLHSEISEALEAHREFGFASHVREDGKPEGWASELADIFIRLGDLAVATGVNLEQEIVNKMDFNDTRPMKHGKRY